MSFIDDSELNVMSIMKEATAVGGVGGFIGRAGRDIDQLFAGAYHPDSGHGSENEKLLQSLLVLDRRWLFRSEFPRYKTLLLFCALWGLDYFLRSQETLERMMFLDRGHLETCRYRPRRCFAYR